jgi:hypothetical protein
MRGIMWSLNAERRAAITRGKRVYPMMQTLWAKELNVLLAVV